MDEGVEVRKTSFKWSSVKANQFKRSLDENGVHLLIHELEILKNDTCQEKMDMFCNGLCNVFINTAKKIEVCKDLKSSNTGVRKNANIYAKPWFDNECKRERAEYLCLKNRLKKIKSEDSARQQDYWEQVQQNYQKKMQGLS